MEPEELFHGAGGEIAALERAAREQGVSPQLSEARMLLEPVAGGQAEAVLDLGQRRLGKELAEGPLEDVALLRAPHLVVGGDGSHELHEGMVQEGKAHSDSRRLGRPRHLEKVVIGQGDFQIHVEESIELGGASGRGEVAPRDAKRPVRGDAPEEARIEEPLPALGHEELTRIEAVGIRSRGTLDVATRFADEAWGLRREPTHGGLDEATSEEAGNTVIAGENSLAPVALVAAEDLVAAVARQEDAHAGLARVAGAEIGGQGRVVPERLVVGAHDVGKALQRLIGGDDPRVVSGIEMAGGQLRVLELVVALFLEADGEGLNPLTGEP